MELYQVANKKFKLERFPVVRNGPLRAWSAADEYVVDHLDESAFSEKSKLLVLNDSFGALSIPFTGLKTTVLTDSLLSELAIRKNLEGNNLRNDALNFISPTDEIKQKYDILIVGVPKSRSLLEYQLRKIRPFLKPNCFILAGVMVKYLHPSLLSLFQATLGPAEHLPSFKKARLIIIELDPETKSRAPSIPTLTYKLAQHKLEIASAPGVFSREHLDEATRLLLTQIPISQDNKRIADLGSGSGIVGAVTAKNNPNSKIICIDESHLAVYSAQQTFEKNELSNGEYVLSAGFTKFTTNTFDMVISNPPIHQGHHLSPWLAFDLFRQTSKVLKEGGEFIFVVSRNLRCQDFLSKLFKSIEIIKHNSKFCVYRCVK